MPAFLLDNDCVGRIIVRSPADPLIQWLDKKLAAVFVSPISVGIVEGLERRKPDSDDKKLCLERIETLAFVLKSSAKLAVSQPAPVYSAGFGLAEADRLAKLMAVGNTIETVDFDRLLVAATAMARSLTVIDGTPDKGFKALASTLDLVHGKLDAATPDELPG